MSFLSYDTVEEIVWQEVARTDAWNQEIVPLLPKNLDEYALRLRAMSRTSGKIQNASDLLRGLLAYVLCATSFRSLGAWGVLHNVADISGTSWRERLRKSDDWLCWLQKELLRPERQEPSPNLKKRGYGPIELVDASHLKCVGKQGKTWRIHCMYSLFTQELHQVVITSAKEGEGLERFCLQERAIYVHDGGYGYRKQIAQSSDAGAFVVSAFSPKTFPLEDEQGNAIEVVSWLKKQEARAGSVKSFSAFFWQKEQRYQIRVVALRRTEKQTSRSLEKKKKQAGRNHNILQKETIYVAGWLLVLTTLPAQDWNEQEVLSLYRARWQIEMLFKRIKQLLKRHVLNAKTDQTAKATISLLIVSWLMQQEVVSEMRSILQKMYDELEDQREKREEEEEKMQQILSEWALQKVSVDLFCQQVQGPLTRQRVLACLPKLKRHFGISLRKRAHEWHRIAQLLVDPERREISSDCGKSRNTSSALTATLA